MKRPELTADLTHEDRDEMQLLRSEIDLDPERLNPMLAELVLARKIVGWARRYRDRFPESLRCIFTALDKRHRAQVLERIAADCRAEIEG